MHARHLSPGNGYRSGSIGMGLGASRISPDSLGRGHGLYNSDYRSFNNRGFGRGQGQLKSFQQPPQPPPRKGDILMEAGRLAAEYLVSKGLLPQSALSGKWQNGSLKKQVGDYQDFRLQEDIMQEGRTSAHARLGSGASDVGAGKKRNSDDFSSRNHGKGRRRGEYYQWNQSSELGREYGKNGSWSDRSRVSPDMEGEDDAVSANYEEQQVGEATGDGMQKSGLSGSAIQGEEPANMEQGAEYADEIGSKGTTYGFDKDETDKESSKVSDDLTDFNSGNEEKDNNQNYETEKQIVSEGSTNQHCAVERDISDKHGSDLLTFCKFAKVPTKTRSALTYRVPKVEQVLNSEEEKTREIGSDVLVQDSTVEFSTANVLPNTIPEPETSKEVSVQSAEVQGELDSTYGAAQGKCMRSQSFPDRIFMHNSEQKLSQGMLNFGRSTSVKERDEKRVAENSDLNEAIKKPREWLPALVSTASDHLHLSNFSRDQASSREGMASSDQPVIGAVAEDSMVYSHQFPKSGGDPCADYPQEKHLYTSSFKICDLNLMEASDMNDNHCNNDQVLMYSSVATSKMEAAQIDVDLSISNSNLSGEYTRCTSSGKNIEVIDLENDSTSEDKDFDNSQRKETAFTGTEGFPNRAKNAGDITDAQENYDGLISEFLTNFSNCSSVAEDINPLQDDMGLHNGEETLGDDDSIYMSLGEIPLSFIPAWEQPTPNEYGKPF